jgi:mono/diheme cytochrome c family protein
MTCRLTTCLWLALLAAACSHPDAPAGDPRFNSPAARARGREAFLKYCTLCHGEAGNGQGARRAAFARPPRDFTDQAWRQSVTPEQVFARIRDGVPGTAMPTWRTLGDQTMADLTAYVISLGAK